MKLNTFLSIILLIVFCFGGNAYASTTSVISVPTIFNNAKNVTLGAIKIQEDTENEFVGDVVFSIQVPYSESIANKFDTTSQDFIFVKDSGNVEHSLPVSNVTKANNQMVTVRFPSTNNLDTLIIRPIVNVSSQSDHIDVMIDAPAASTINRGTFTVASVTDKKLDISVPDNPSNILGIDYGSNIKIIENSFGTLANGIELTLNDGFEWDLSKTSVLAIWGSTNYNISKIGNTGNQILIKSNSSTTYTSALMVRPAIKVNKNSQFGNVTVQVDDNPTYFTIAKYINPDKDLNGIVDLNDITKVAKSVNLDSFYLDDNLSKELQQYGSKFN